MSVSKPATLTPWATTLAPYPISGLNNRVQPPASWQTDGWDENEEPAPNYENWMKWEHYSNIAYLLQETMRAATAVVAAADSASFVDIEGDYKCDGTDDQVQINAAISAVAAAGGGTVLLTDGIFSVKDTINLGSNVTLRGMGRSTKIQVDSGTVIDFNLITGGALFNGVVCDLTLDGNKTAHAQYNSGVFIGGGSNNLVTRCWIENMRYDSVTPAFGMGVMLTGAASYRNRVEGCTFDACEASGIYSDSSQDSVYVATNIVTGCGSAVGVLRGAIEVASPHSIIAGNQVGTANTYGIDSTGALSKVVNNYIQNTTGTGIRLNGDGAEASQNTVLGSSAIGIYLQGAESVCANNNIEATGTYGIYADGADLCSIEQNRIKSAGYHGIYLSGSAFVMCNGNKIIDASQDTHNFYSGIFLDGTGDREQITNNKFYNTGAVQTKHSIEDSGVGSNPAVYGNDCALANSASTPEILDASGSMRSVPVYVWDPGTAAHVSDSQLAIEYCNRVA